MYESKFRDYGKPFGVGDIIMCYVDLDANPKAMFFMVNGQYLGVAFRFTNELNGQAVYPHVACKNMKFKINFGQDPPAHPLTSNFRMMQSLSVDDLVSPPLGPTKPEEAEMIMMVGLPACGKSVWCENYAKEHKDKKYYILGTNLIIDRMKVSGLIRKRNYHGRWEELIKRASAVLNKLFDVSKKRPRNYILDQTNVYFTARRRKMESFRGYKRIAAVLVNTPEVLDTRTEKQRKDEGKLVPEEAVMEMKKNFSLPEVGPSFDDVWYLEEKLPGARTLVESYRSEGVAFKNKRPFSGPGGPTPTPANEPANKRSKPEEKGFNSSRNAPSRDQPPKLMEQETAKPDSRPPRDQKREDRGENSRREDRDRDRRRDRNDDRGRDNHREDKRGPRDDRRDSRGDRRDPLRSDRRDMGRDSRDSAREGRDFMRDGREPPRGPRDSSRDGHDPQRDNRGMQQRDNREPLNERMPSREGGRDMVPSRDMRDSMQDQRGPPPREMSDQPPHDLRDPLMPLDRRDRPFGEQNEPPHDMRHEPIRDEFPPRDDRQDFREREPPFDRDGRLMPGGDHLGPDTGRGRPPSDMRGGPMGRDNRLYQRDDYQGRDERDCRDGRMPYPESGDQGRRYPGNDWRNQSFEDEYRSQYTEDKAATFRRDLPFPRDHEKMHEEGYFDDPREREPSSDKFSFQTGQSKQENRDDYMQHRANGQPPRGPPGGPPSAPLGGPPGGSTSGPPGRDDPMGFGPSDRFGRPDEKPRTQGYGGPNYRDERYPVDPARREPERPGFGGPRQMGIDPIKSDPDVPLDSGRSRFDGRPGAVDVPPVGDTGLGRRPEGEHGLHRDYSQGFGEPDKPGYGARPNLNRPPSEADRFASRGPDPIKSEPGRPEQGRYDQGRYDQARPGPDTWQGQPGWPEPNRPDQPPAGSSKSLMDIPVSDYGRRSDHDQKLFDQRSQDPKGYDQRAPYDKPPVDEKPRYDQGGYGASGDYSTPYSYPPKNDFNQKPPESRYDQQSFGPDKYGKPADPHAPPIDRTVSGQPTYGGPAANTWKTPEKTDTSHGRYDNPNSYGQGSSADRWGSQEQSSYYQQSSAERPNPYNRDPPVVTSEVGRYPSQAPPSAQSSTQPSYNQPGRDSSINPPPRGPPSQQYSGRNPYDAPPMTTYEQPIYGSTVSTATSMNKSYGYSLSTTTQNYSNNNDRMSYSYQTQMTTSTANYGQAQSAAGGYSAYQAQRYGTADTTSQQRPSESSVPPPTQPSYGRPSDPTQQPPPAAPTPQDNYGSGGSQSTYEQQQQDYQKAYKQWYANYAQAYAQLAQQQPPK